MTQVKHFKGTLGGKEFKFWLGLGFLSSFLKESKTTLETFNTALGENPFELVPLMVYCSIKYGYDRVGADLDFTKFEVVEWIDDEGGVASEFVEKFLKHFTAAMADPNESKEVSKGKEKPALNGKNAQKKTKTLK